MLKKIIVAALMVQLIIVPAIAAETNQPKPIACTKGFIGIDDAIWIFIGSYVTVRLLGIWADARLERKAKEQKVQEQQKTATPDCKL